MYPTQPGKWGLTLQIFSRKRTCCSKCGTVWRLPRGQSDRHLVLSRLPDIDQSLARIIKVPGSGGDPKQIVGILRTIHSICVALELSATIIAQEGVVDADAWRPIKEVGRRITAG